LNLNNALCALLVLVVSPAFAGDRVKQATDIILKLCIASGVQTIEITKKGNFIEVAGTSSSLQIGRRESSGLIGGISKEITTLSAQQASEARSCAQKYLKKLVDIILKDEPGNGVQGSGRAIVSSHGSVEGDAEKFWGGRGIWEDNQSYCQRLLEFLSASTEPENFTYENGEKVSLKTVTSAGRNIVGNYFVKTEAGSAARFCRVYYNAKATGGAYNALHCGRTVSVRRLDVFASVYNQTLKDMRDCLLPAKWKQTTLDQGACFPSGTGRGECVRRFEKGSRRVWLYSNLDEEGYYMGIQTKLGN
jgi:hypothetical protein